MTRQSQTHIDMLKRYLLILTLLKLAASAKDSVESRAQITILQLHLLEKLNRFNI